MLFSQVLSMYAIEISRIPFRIRMPEIRIITNQNVDTLVNYIAGSFVNYTSYVNPSDCVYGYIIWWIMYHRKQDTIQNDSHATFFYITHFGRLLSFVSIFFKANHIIKLDSWFYQMEINMSWQTFTLTDVSNFLVAFSANTSSFPTNTMFSTCNVFSGAKISWKFEYIAQEWLQWVIGQCFGSEHANTENCYCWLLHKSFTKLLTIMRNFYI